jgi:hypothetical protein
VAGSDQRRQSAELDGQSKLQEFTTAFREDAGLGSNTIKKKIRTS